MQYIKRIPAKAGKRRRRAPKGPPPSVSCRCRSADGDRKWPHRVEQPTAMGRLTLIGVVDLDRVPECEVVHDGDERRLGHPARTDREPQRYGECEHHGDHQAGRQRDRVERSRQEGAGEEEDREATEPPIRILTDRLLAVIEHVPGGQQHGGHRASGDDGLCCYHIVEWHHDGCYQQQQHRNDSDAFQNGITSLFVLSHCTVVARHCGTPDESYSAWVCSRAKR